MRVKVFPILVSACLVGLNTRFDGTNRENKALLAVLRKYFFIPVCPEQLGGLKTPRPPASIVAGTGKGVLERSVRIVSKEGIDVSEHYIRGAFETLSIARLTGAKSAILKDKSPACGTKYIYNDNRLVNGSGVAAYLLQREGIEVFSENNWPEIFNGI